MIPRIDVTRETQGRWPEIHAAIGIPAEYLRNIHQPCPICGGRDRFRYDDKDGRGSYYCNQCGAGDGFTLAMKYHGWDFARAASEVRQVLGLNESQRALVAAKMANLTPSDSAKIKHGATANLQSQTRAEAAEKLNVSERSKHFPYAQKLWKAAIWTDEYTAAHPYAIRKGITHAAGAARGTATGKLIGREADCIVVPMRTLGGELTGVECINAEGVKQTFGNKGVLVLGNDLDAALPQLIVEGWATAVAILNLYRWKACVYACFGKGMLTKLAGQVADMYADRIIIIAGESDA